MLLGSLLGVTFRDKQILRRVDDVQNYHVKWEHVGKLPIVTYTYTVTRNKRYKKTWEL